jgi:hypothetical protein
MVDRYRIGGVGARSVAVMAISLVKAVLKVKLKVSAKIASSPPEM